MREKLKPLIRRIPVVRRVLRAFEKRAERKKNPLRQTDASSVFTTIYRENYWGSDDSHSGGGSNLEQTAVVRQEIPRVIDQYNIRSMIDLPCGDFNWMREVDLRGATYVGCDIVEQLVSDNQRNYSRADRSFLVLNVLENNLPAADLLFCRDLFVHFSFADLRSALRIIGDSPITYILTTTFTDREENRDIKTGDWRTLNLLKAPFLFPEPLELINERCTEFDGQFADKSLGLWRLSELKKHIELSPG